MLFNGPRVHLSRQELNRLRQANARNGHVVNHVGTRDDLIEAIVHGLPESIQRDLVTIGTLVYPTCYLVCKEVSTV